MQKEYGKVRFETEGFAEFTLNALWRNGIRVRAIKRNGRKMRFTVSASDSAAAHAALSRAGINYTVTGTGGFVPALNAFLKRYFLIAGLAVSVAVVTLYCGYVGDVRVEGADRVDPAVVSAVVEEALPSSFLFGSNDFSAIERKVLSIDGIAYASIRKEGRHVVIEIVEELPITEITDTQTPLPLAAKEDGEIVRIVVLRGFAAVGTGDSVKAGQVLINPYVAGADGEIAPVRAMGIVEAKVRRTETIDYLSEDEFNSSAADDILLAKQAFTESLSGDDKFIGYSFDVKKLDKCIQISIYYDIITRIA